MTQISPPADHGRPSAAREADPAAALPPALRRPPAPFLSRSGLKLEIAILLMLALTWAAIRYADVLLHKELVIAKQSDMPFRVGGYDDRQEGTGNSVLTIDPDNRLKWHCDLKPGFFPNPFCGYEIILADESGTRGIDLSNYHDLTIDLTYKGAANSVRVFLKNFNPRYSTPNVRSTSKFHSTEIFFPGRRITKTIPISQFPVAEWWVVREQQDPQATAPELDNVISIDIDTATRAEPGRQDFELHSIKLTGTIIPLEQFYLIIIGCWVAAIASFLAWRLASRRKRAGRARALQEMETQRLQQAIAASERANSAKSRFLSSMSHELRTPLNAILGYAQLIERGDPSPRHGAAARTIRESGAHLLTLINDILDLSKIEAGKLELNPANFDLHALLRGVEDMIRIRAAEKDLDFRCIVPPDLPRFVIGDETRLRQVLINLLGNAVKFTKAGEVTLRLTSEPAAAGASRLTFEVSDTGVGLDRDEIERIFTPFEQTGDAEGKAAGTGLGLAITQQMVALMGGEIGVESEKGRGSRFSFTVALPIALAAPGAEPLKPEMVTGYAGTRRKVLIVDDLEANRLLLVQELGDLGFDTVEAADGAEALEHAAESRPDLVFMDLRMPGMDGFEAIRRLRANETLAGLPVIAFSASATSEVEERSLRAGASAFLAKPIERATMLGTIGRLLDLDWIAGDRAAPPDTAGGESAEQLLAPPPEHMDALLHLARAGNMTGISRQAAEIIAMDERYRPFGEKLRSLARSYQSPALLALIERHSPPREAA